MTRAIKIWKQFETVCWSLLENHYMTYINYISHIELNHNCTNSVRYTKLNYIICLKHETFECSLINYHSCQIIIINTSIFEYYIWLWATNCFNSATIYLKLSSVSFLQKLLLSSFTSHLYAKHVLLLASRTRLSTRILSLIRFGDSGTFMSGCNDDT